MTHRNPIRTLLIVGLLATCGAAFPAGASTTPAERCAASQLTAVGKLASASLACHAATATTLDPPTSCIWAAMTAFERAWAAAEAKGGCITTANETDAESQVFGAVAAAVGELTGTPEDALLTTPAAQACAVNKLKAAANEATALFACDTTVVKQGALVSAACVNKAGGALVKAWDAAEAKGGCATVGDTEALPFDGLAAWGVMLLAPPPSSFLSCGTFLSAWGPFDTSGVAVDGSGDVFVTGGVWNDNWVRKFDNYGTFLTKWGSTGSGDGQFNGPHGIAVGPAQNVFVADNFNNRIEKFDNYGTFLTKWGSPGTGDGQFNNPAGVAVDGNRNVFVADEGNNRIQKFDHNGTFLTAWGSPGTGAGQFATPVGIAVDGSGNVFVVDWNNSRVQKFDNNGVFLTTWGKEGSGKGEFKSAFGIAVDGSGNVFVVDQQNARIEQFDNNGTFLTEWDSKLNDPEGVAVDGSGNVFVIDYLDASILKFACPPPPPVP
jgi:DNA-binding beta-propeller fold protein YncE